MLQQTRVAAAIAYFERFVGRFPGFTELAAASEDEVLASWAGLGYYYRARNLHKAAKRVAAQGYFPSDYESIRRLPGVGYYTAAAVASIALGQAHAAVDGNVIRVLSRVSDERTQSDSSQGRRHFQLLANHVLDARRPGDFNQALMELGATICLPSTPKCLICPAVSLCRAHKEGTEHERPVKKAAAKSVQELRTVYWIEVEERLLAWQRSPDETLMPGFWELPERDQLPRVENREIIGRFRHRITFHDYRFELCEGVEPPDIGNCQWIAIKKLDRLPVSTILKKARRLIEKHREGINWVCGRS